MFSMSADLSKYSSYRNKEIKALRESLAAQLVTHEELDATRTRLQKLRKARALLEQEDHTELRTVLKNSQDTITDLAQQRAYHERELTFRENQVNDLAAIRKELQTKFSYVSDQVKKEWEEGEENKRIGIAQEKFLKDLENEISKSQIEVQEQQELLQELIYAENELKKKLKESKEPLDSLNQSVELLTKKISDQIHKIKESQKNIQENYHQIEKLQLRVLNQHSRQDYYETQISHLKYVKEQNECRKQIHEYEINIEQKLNSFSQSLVKNTQQKKNKQQNLQIKSKQLYKDLIEEDQKKEQLWAAVQEAQQSLNLLRQKNQNLKLKMQEAFKQDSEMMKNLANKKAICSSDVLESKKQHFIGKENAFLKDPVLSVLTKQSLSRVDSKQALQSLFMNQSTVSRVQ